MPCNKQLLLMRTLTVYRAGSTNRKERLPLGRIYDFRISARVASYGYALASHANTIGPARVGRAHGRAVAARYASYRLYTTFERDPGRRLGARGAIPPVRPDRGSCRLYVER